MEVLYRQPQLPWILYCGPHHVQKTAFARLPTTIFYSWPVVVFPLPWYPLSLRGGIEIGVLYNWTFILLSSTLWLVTHFSTDCSPLQKSWQHDSSMWICINSLKGNWQQDHLLKSYRPYDLPQPLLSIMIKTSGCTAVE